MSLVPPILDDRRFEDLKTEAFERVRQACPEWTDFNPSDPGVTLIELFAWFVELMMFRINQIPDKLQGELLDLVGVRPEAAKPARAVIEFESDTPANAPATITKYKQSNQVTVDGTKVGFQTERDLAMVRASLAALVRVTSGTEEDLTALNKLANRGFDPFGESGKSDFRLHIKAWPDASIDDVFPAAMTLHVTLTERTFRDAPRFDPLTGRPQPPDLRWETLWQDDHGEWVWEPIEVIEDETQSFERGGFIRLGRPEHATLFSESQQKKDQPCFKLRCRVGKRGFAFGRAPRMRHLALNAVSAVALINQSEENLGPSDGTAGQTFFLRNRPVEPSSVALVTRTQQKGSPDEVWSLAADLSEAGERRLFMLDATDGKIQFGDGKYGAIPIAGRSVIASYSAGGGTVGNVKAKAITFKVSDPAKGGIWNGTNPFAASGGTDARPIEELRLQAPARLRSLDRAVIQADYEDLAKRKGRMARARAFANLHPDFPELKGRMPGVITVFVVAPLRLNGVVPPWPTDGELDQATAELEKRRTVGCELFVRPAQIVPIKVTLKVAPTEDLASDEVRQAVSKSLNRWLNDDARGIGTPLYGGDVWAYAMQAKVGPTVAIKQIYDLTIDADKFGKLHLQLSTDGKKQIKVTGRENDQSVALVIPDHAVLWGRPDHEIQLLDGGS